MFIIILRVLLMQVITFVALPFCVGTLRGVLGVELELVETHRGHLVSLCMLSNVSLSFGLQSRQHMIFHMEVIMKVDIPAIHTSTVRFIIISF